MEQNHKNAPTKSKRFPSVRDASPPEVSLRFVEWSARYLRRYFAGSFDAVRVSGHEGLAHLDRGPLVVYANHPSWWDPILFVLLGSEYLANRVGYGPMDAAALEKYRILTKLGVFGVEQGTRAGAVQFLKTGEAILRRPGTVLWITAEGEFVDPRRRPVTLRPGLSHLIRRVGSATAIPLAIEYTFWNERLPEVLVRFGEAVKFDDDAWSLPTASINQRLERQLEATMDRLAEDVQLRSAAEFTTLLAGRAGVGGVYDVWRRLVARLQGRDFDASHEGDRS